MLLNTRVGIWRTWMVAVAVVGTLGATGAVHADDVVDHLVRQGNMPRRSANKVVDRVSRKMMDNAARGGTDYDRVRQAVGMALFGASGAGGTLEEYNARLAQVLSKLGNGLDLWALSALFGGDTIVQCRKDFGLSTKDCRSLARAANVTPVIDVDGLLAEARSAFQSGNYSRAAEAYEQVTNARPTEAAAFAGLGQSRIRIGDGRGAVDALRRAIELAPNVANLRAYLGRALMATGDRAGAAAAFREALSLNSSHADAKAGLRELESTPAMQPAPAPMQARAPMVASNAPGTSSTAPRFGTPRFGPVAPYAPAAAAPVAPQTAQTGGGSFGGGRFGGGQAASAGPNPTAVQWVQKGQAHLQARQFTQALAAFRMGASFDPGYAVAFAGIGAASMGAGDRPGAARAYQTAVRLAPESADYHAGLGDALAATGDNETAIAAYRRALGIAPGHRAATAGLARLEGGGTSAAVASAPPAAPGRPGAPAVSTVAVAPQPTPTPAPAPQPVVAPTAPAPRPTAAPTPAPRVAVAPEPEPTPEPEPAAEPVVEDDLIAGLLSDPLGPSGPSRGRGQSSSSSRGGGSSSAPAPSSSSSAPSSSSSSSSSLPQTPSRDQVAEVMRGLQSTVKACVPDLTGSISVQITITGATGEVTDASVVGREADDPEAICVSEVVRGATFPHFAKETLKIKFPFQL